MRLRGNGWFASFLVATALLMTPGVAGAATMLEIRDVQPDHWAYRAVKTLVERYGIVEPGPEQLFRGTRNVSRFELAAMLAKVLERVEQMAATIRPAEDATQAGPVRPDDLRLLRRLVQEFQDELTGLKDLAEAQDRRLSALEERPRMGGRVSAWLQHTTASAGTPAGEPTARVLSTWTLESAMGPGATYHGELSFFGTAVQRMASGHRILDGGRAGEPFDQSGSLYVRRSAGVWTASGTTLHVGIMTLSDALRSGPSSGDPFRENAAWPLGESGLGLVGTPPVVNRDTGITLVPANPDSPLPTPAGRVRWNPGVQAVEDLLDPNSSWATITGAGPAAALSTTWGPLEAGLGLHAGAPGASQTLALIDQPATFPLVAPLGQGYALAKLGLDGGWIRGAVYGRSDWATLTAGTGEGQGWGGGLDLGDSNLGLHVAHARMNRRLVDAGERSESIVMLASHDLFGTGLELGVASKWGAGPGQAASAAWLPGVTLDWCSSGAYLKLPGFARFTHLTIAGQMSGKDLFTSHWGSGITIQTAWEPLPGFPRLRLQYDQGRFYGAASTPAPAGFKSVELANALFGGAAQTHELWLVGTDWSF